MVAREQIRERALAIGFVDAGFTTVDVFSIAPGIPAGQTGGVRLGRKGRPRSDGRNRPPQVHLMTYFGEGITLLELRDPMGMYVYGFDMCQNVCPRNAPWLVRNLPENRKVAAKAEHLDLARLLSMDSSYFQLNVWPHKEISSSVR